VTNSLKKIYRPKCADKLTILIILCKVGWLFIQNTLLWVHFVTKVCFKYGIVCFSLIYMWQGIFWYQWRAIFTNFCFNFLWPLPVSLRFILYVGRAAGFEPELVKPAALPRYQWAIPALYFDKKNFVWHIYWPSKTLASFLQLVYVPIHIIFWI
jgi:hypothetical protein